MTTCKFCNNMRTTPVGDEPCDSCRTGKVGALDRLADLGLDEELISMFSRLLATSGVSPEQAMLRVIADLTSDARLPHDIPVSLLMRRVRSWQAAVRRLAEVYAAPRGR
jgi:hypothetical protein